MNTSRMMGFSIVELLITLAILGLSVTLIAPSMQSFVTRNKVSTHINQLVKIIHMARESAIYKNKTVILCRSRSGIDCDGDWHEGILLFTDANRDKRRNSNEEIIHHLPGFINDDRLYWRAFRNRQYLEMSPRGFTAWQNGTFTYCPVEGIEYARGIILNAAGRIRLTQDSNNDGIHEGTNGRALRC